MEKKKSSNVLVIILLIVLVGAGAYIFYQTKSYNDLDKKCKSESNKIEEKSTETEKSSEQINKKTYNADDYVSISDFEQRSCSWCEVFSVVKKIELKNLPERTTTEFMAFHNGFLYPPSYAWESSTPFSNEVLYEVDDNILSVYTKQNNAFYEYPSQYSLNVNLDNNKIVTNEELLNKYSIKSLDMYEKILTNIANTVTTKEFLLSTSGDVTAEKISIDEFKQNIKTYATYIDNRYDGYTLYLKDNKVNVVYNQATILKLIGMGTHMGIGLAEPNIQTIQLN